MPSSSGSRKRTQSAADIPDEAKTVLARLYQEQHANGKTRRDFAGDLRAAGYDVSERQLDRWVERVHDGEPAVSMTKATGAVARLSCGTFSMRRGGFGKN